MGSPRNTQHFAPARLGLLSVGLLLLAACGSSKSATSTSASSAPAGASPSSQSASAAGEGTKVTVSEDEFNIKLDRSSFPPGAYTFVADNTGKFPHALTIDGPGISDQGTATLSPGSSGSVTVTLQNGSYEIYCPVDGHKSKGMDTHITVGAVGSGGTGTSSSSGPSSSSGSSGGSTY